MDRGRHRWSATAACGAAALCAGASLLATSPEVRAVLGAGLPTGAPWPGTGVDRDGTLFFIDWLAAAPRRAALGHEPLLYAPIGWDAGLATGFAWADLIPAAFARGLGAPAAAVWGAHLIWTVAGSAAAVAWMAQRAGARPAGAAVLGALAALHPLVARELGEGRPTQAWLAPAAVLFGLALGGRSAGSAVGAGLALALACLSYWFVGAAAGLAVGLGLLAGVGRLPRLPGVTRAAGIAGVGVAVAAVFAWPAIAPWLPGSGAPPDAAWSRPPWAHVDLGLLRLPVRRPGAVDGPGAALALHADALPPEWLVLGGLGALAARRRIAALAWVALICGFTLAPWLTWPGGGAPTGAWLLDLVFPPLARNRWPDRLFPVPLLAAAWLAARAMARHPRRLFALAAAALVARAATGGPLPAAPPPAPLDPVLAAGPGGIIDVPLSRAERTYPLVLAHGRPLLGGPGLARVRPPAHAAWCEANPLLAGLEALARGEAPAGDWSSGDADALRRAGLGLIVLWTDEVRVPVHAVASWLGAPPTLRAGPAAVWRLDAVLPPASAAGEAQAPR